MELVDEAGKSVVEYSYDEWGRSDYITLYRIWNINSNNYFFYSDHESKIPAGLAFFVRKRGKSIIQRHKKIGGVMYREAYRISSKGKAIATTIGNSFARARTIPRYRSRREKHHIVAKAAPSASRAAN